MRNSIYAEKWSGIASASLRCRQGRVARPQMASGQAPGANSVVKDAGPGFYGQKRPFGDRGRKLRTWRVARGRGVGRGPFCRADSPLSAGQRLGGELFVRKGGLHFFGVPEK